MMGWSHETAVAFAGDGTGHAGFGAEQGIAVAVRDDDGFLHCYLHLDRAVAAVGESVLAGETVVGLQGNTGTLTTGSRTCTTGCANK